MNEIYVARLVLENYLLPTILIGVFCICAGCCAANPNFQPPLLHLEEFSHPHAY